MNFQSKVIPATGAAAAAAVGIAIATCAPAVAAPNLIGSGCAAYDAANPTGPASVSGMQQDRVADAASHNPELTMLTKAVSGQLNPDVNLVDALNSGDLTVFAPTDAAFAKLPEATVEKLKTDAPLLSGILKYHVVSGQLSPAKVEGSHNTLEGKAVKVNGSGDGLKVNDAGLVCGGVPTANATVYMIDTVLTPPGQ